MEGLDRILRNYQTHSEIVYELPIGKLHSIYVTPFVFEPKRAIELNGRSVGRSDKEFNFVNQWVLPCPVN